MQINMLANAEFAYCVLSHVPSPLPLLDRISAARALQDICRGAMSFRAAFWCGGHG